MKLLQLMSQHLATNGSGLRCKVGLPAQVNSGQYLGMVSIRDVVSCLLLRFNLAHQAHAATVQPARDLNLLQVMNRNFHD